MEHPGTAPGHRTLALEVPEACAGATNVVGVSYLCAFLLDVGDALQGASEDMPGWIEIDGEGGISRALDPEQVFYADVDPDVRTTFLPQLIPQSLRSFGEPQTAGAASQAHLAGRRRGAPAAGRDQPAAPGPARRPAPDRRAAVRRGQPAGHVTRRRGAGAPASGPGRGRRGPDAKLELHQVARELGLSPAVLASLYKGEDVVLATEREDRVLRPATDH